MEAHEILKEEVCSLLNVKPRTVERYVKDSKLSCRYEDGKRGGTIAVFDRQEVEALRDSMNREATAPRPYNKESGVAATGDATGEMMTRTSATAIIATYGTQIVDAITLLSDSRRAVEMEQMTLSIDQMREASGLPRRMIVEACRSGALPTIDGVRQYRSRGEDFVRYVRTLTSRQCNQ